ncbi:G-type lectin S-receptor-like serine/threonine-protein kinase B120 isoform X2 [Typha latifolia]|uniref:G-type lectin S-receptor-like serine/threonine-protein kinase B120 isoform X2 n=1 Tax=Typha latifolia TaxID=4733 RepID=UPI003C2F5000
MALHLISNPSLVLSSLLIFSTSLSFLSHASDILPQDQPLRDGQMLVSAGGTFELGFFRPGKSVYRYVGIWHRNTSTQSVVWVANRENPVVDSSGSLTVNATGNLVLTDGKGNVVWSTVTSSTEASSNYSMHLSDLGNLALRAGDGTTTWESFDHPTDTFLPGMTIRLDVKKGIRTLFTSWKNPDDPSPGNYTLGLDPLGSAQIFIWEFGSKLLWRSGQYNGQGFTGIIYRPLNSYGFKLMNDIVRQGFMYYTYSTYNNSIQKFVLEPNGVEKCSMLIEDTGEWTTVWEQPVNECEMYNYCGINAKCSVTDTPKCSCLKGFEPKSIGEWGAGNWSGGCVRRTPLDCQNNLSGDGFTKLGSVKLPDLSNWLSLVNDGQECERSCLGNCSCAAYAYTNFGCFTWGHDLMDIYQLADGQYDMFIKLPASELGSKSKVWIPIVIVPIVVVFILATCSFLWWKYRKQIKDLLQNGGKKESLFSGNRSQIEAKIDFSGPSQYGEERDEGKGSELPLFTFGSIATATSNFSDSNKLGHGGFGHVYKGLLPGGEEIAVKRLSRSSGQGIEEFKNEVILIAKLQHRNLVRLIGCCIEGEEKILIYEYLPNKSLDAFLFDPTKQASLDWKMRFNIIEGIARGLLYLHRDSRLRIVHRDLKASNILLDEEMNPKISDFGMARIFGRDQNQVSTNRVVGTYGYMSPEYAMEGLFSVKSDVYSFGILILEIISGKRNSSFHHIEECPNIVGYAYQLWKEDKAEELIDPSIRSSCPIQQVVRSIHIALLCVQDRVNERPDIPYVILMLSSLSSVLPTPKPPTFRFHGSTDDAGKVESFSTYDVTITMLHGR